MWGGPVDPIRSGVSQSGQEALSCASLLPAGTSGQQEEAVTAYFYLVEVAQAVLHSRVETSAIDSGSIVAFAIDDRADRAVHQDLAVHPADEIFLEGEVALIAAADDGLPADDAMNPCRIATVDDNQHEGVGRAEGRLTPWPVRGRGLCALGHAGNVGVARGAVKGRTRGFSIKPVGPPAGG